PLTDRLTIEARLDAVADLIEAHSLRQELRNSLEQVSDLHRLSGRAGTGRASPRDLAAVARTLRLLPAIRARLRDCKANLLRELEQYLETCPELCQALDAALADDPPANAHESGVIREGYDTQLDEQRALARSGKEWLARFQAEEAVRTGIQGLKVCF